MSARVISRDEPRRLCESLMVALHALEEMSEDLQASQAFDLRQAIAVSLMTMRTSGSDHGVRVFWPSERLMSSPPTIR